MLLKTIILDKYEIEAHPCRTLFFREKETCVINRVTAVDLYGSKCLEINSSDNGIVVLNENNYGFFITWDEYKELRKTLDVKGDDEFDDFLDMVITDLVDTVIRICNGK